MSIVPELECDTSTGSVHGYTTLPVPGAPAKSIATHALVFMLGGVSSRWKLVVGYHYTGVQQPGRVHSFHRQRAGYMVEVHGWDKEVLTTAWFLEQNRVLMFLIARFSSFSDVVASRQRYQALRKKKRLIPKLSCSYARNRNDTKLAAT
ncbi:hypothetical protein HPB48_021031 [Haemaphysalis longicornis]|uniref:Transposable element P transposase-like RNase H domain-containing protein n=1 Tax=Haemaphysalis longicornis TaxID=44386 RepID=A0A9J6GBH9_HAELO|nr:hypothetical protein HPB48_021031 [Haemaphysalis longicornis]